MQQEKEHVEELLSIEPDSFQANLQLLFIGKKYIPLENSLFETSLAILCRLEPARSNYFRSFLVSV